MLNGEKLHKKLVLTLRKIESKIIQTPVEIDVDGTVLESIDFNTPELIKIKIKNYSGYIEDDEHLCDCFDRSFNKDLLYKFILFVEYKNLTINYLEYEIGFLECEIRPKESFDYYKDLFVNEFKEYNFLNLIL